jgi:hypothetical protein
MKRVAKAPRPCMGEGRISNGKSAGISATDGVISSRLRDD